MSFREMLATGIKGSEESFFLALKAGIVFCVIIISLEFLFLLCRHRRKRNETGRNETDIY